jgi:hypothetical protein
MDIDPTHAAPTQVPAANKCGNLAMRDGSRLMEMLVRSQKCPAPSAITNEKLSIDQVVSCYFVQTEESVQLGGEGRPVGKKPNPHRSVD